MENRIGESMYCFIEERKEGWYFTYGVNKGDGQKDAAVLPKRDGETLASMEDKIGDIALWYLNNSNHKNVFNNLETRIINECKREIRDLVDIFWHSIGKTIHVYASKNAEGRWEIVDDDPKWIIIGNKKRRDKQEKENEDLRIEQRIHAAKERKSSEEQVNSLTAVSSSLSSDGKTINDTESNSTVLQNGEALVDDSKNILSPQGDNGEPFLF
ncbi:hypothetical protein [Paenibacillus sp. Leaf72]|uniref:hypothetical protein n=1 Tax=Paenibacillus sp. Leaf72 TaxID=1736234 RepID=UPI0006FFB9A6|nr:hypothetical protein [Paenibacillus sp. Leaf72]KQN96827.1 hypothetical protein ASF12_22405 [Paenibacillus sp. Leaf72]